MVRPVAQGVGVDEPLVIKLIPGRECGGCTVCCVDLTIDDPELQKPQGYRCRNVMRVGGCSIYDTRPMTCRTFNCGWRQLKWVKQTLRPDLSGVLVRLQYEVTREDNRRRLGIVITLLNSASLKADGLAETVAAAIAADIPVSLNIPGPPGQTSAVAKINDALAEAVMFKDKALILSILRRIRAQGKTGPRATITFKNRPQETGQLPADDPDASDHHYTAS